MTHTTTEHKRHTAHKAHKAPLHVRHIDKIAKVSKRSRLWCEIATCAGTAYETHLIVLAIASIVWMIVDVVLVIVGRTEEEL